jgi:hypothetical protein
MTQYGPATVYAGTGRSWAVPSYVGPVSANGNYSWGCGYMQTGTSAQYAQPFGRTANSGTAQPFNNWDFELNPGGLGQTIARTTWNNNGNQAVSGNLTVSNNTLITLFGFLTGGPGANSATGTASVNGVSQGGSTFNQTPANFSIGSVMQIGNIPGNVFWGGFWSRPLSVNETMTLHTDPYCFLLYDQFDGNLSFPLTSVSPSQTAYVISSSRPGLPSVAIYDSTNLTTMVSDVGAEHSYSSSVDATTTLSGIAGTAAVGSLTASLSASTTLTGVAATGAVGTLIAALDASVTLTGVAGTAAVGSLTEVVTADRPLSGIAATGALGTFDIQLDSDQTLTGIAGIAAIGTLVPELIVAIDGVAATAAVGTVIDWVQEPAIGIHATAALGTVVAAADQTAVVFGISTFGSVGIPLTFTGPNVSNTTIPSIHATAAVGHPIVRVSETLTGIAASGQVHALTPLVTARGLHMAELDSETIETEGDIKVNLRWSDDKGASWSGSTARTFGAEGTYLTSLQWRRLGMARDRVFEISWSAPIETSLNGMSIQFEISKT